MLNMDRDDFILLFEVSNEDMEYFDSQHDEDGLSWAEISQRQIRTLKYLANKKSIM